MAPKIQHSDAPLESRGTRLSVETLPWERSQTRTLTQELLHHHASTVRLHAMASYECAELATELESLRNKRRFLSESTKALLSSLATLPDNHEAGPRLAQFTSDLDLCTQAIVSHEKRREKLRNLVFHSRNADEKTIVVIDKLAALQGLERISLHPQDLLQPTDSDTATSSSPILPQELSHYYTKARAWNVAQEAYADVVADYEEQAMQRQHFADQDRHLEVSDGDFEAHFDSRKSQALQRWQRAEIEKQSAETICRDAGIDIHAQSLGASGGSDTDTTDANPGALGDTIAQSSYAFLPSLKTAEDLSEASVAKDSAANVEEWLEGMSAQPATMHDTPQAWAGHDHNNIPTSPSIAMPISPKARSRLGASAFVQDSEGHVRSTVPETNTDNIRRDSETLSTKMTFDLSLEGEQSKRLLTDGAQIQREQVAMPREAESLAKVSSASKNPRKDSLHMVSDRKQSTAQQQQPQQSNPLSRDVGAQFAPQGSGREASLRPAMQVDSPKNLSQSGKSADVTAKAQTLPSSLTRKSLGKGTEQTGRRSRSKREERTEK